MILKSNSTHHYNRYLQHNLDKYCAEKTVYRIALKEFRENYNKEGSSFQDAVRVAKPEVAQSLQPTLHSAAACIYGKKFFLDFMLIFEKFRLFYDVGTNF